MHKNNIKKGGGDISRVDGKPYVRWELLGCRAVKMADVSISRDLTLEAWSI
jgi:hypothetical protein